MGKSFRLILITTFLLLSLDIFSLTETKRLGLFFSDYISTSKNKDILLTNYLLNKLDETVDTSILQLDNIITDIDYSNISQIAGYCFTNGYNGFYHFSMNKSDTQDNGKSVELDIVLYNLNGKTLYEGSYIFKTNEHFEKRVDTHLKELKKIIEKSLPLIKPTQKQEVTLSELKTKSKKGLTHNFPYVLISFDAISLKFHYDLHRNNYFNPFPIDIRVNFFPLRYFEFGLFVRFDYKNMIFKYYDVEDKKERYYQSYFNLFYGFTGGVSLFGEKAHFTTGLALYNLFYLVDPSKNWKKANGIKGYFLPQFSLYSRVDIKIVKFLYYSLNVNLKTVQKFELDSKKQFGSTPLNYDLPILEISLIGISLIF